MTSVAVTGHQPAVLGGDDPAIGSRLKALASSWIRDNDPSEIVSGMAAGWDLAVASAAVEAGVPLVAALAHRGQGADWTGHERALLDSLLGASAEIHCLGEARGAPRWDERDRWILERGDLVLALWSGVEGGTGRAVATARGLGKPVTNLWDMWLGMAKAT